MTQITNCPSSGGRGGPAGRLWRPEAGADGEGGQGGQAEEVRRCLRGRGAAHVPVLHRDARGLPQGPQGRQEGGGRRRRRTRLCGVAREVHQGQSGLPDSHLGYEFTQFT